MLNVLSILIVCLVRQLYDKVWNLMSYFDLMSFFYHLINTKSSKNIFLIILDLMSHTTFTSEIKINKYITTLIKYNSKLTKLGSLYEI